MIGWIMVPAVILLTYFGVALFRRWSLKCGFLDVPNDRSSHVTPIPRGGGVVVVLVCLISYLIISLQFPEAFSWGYLFGVALVTLVSWLDDVYSISAVWRFIAHSAAAVTLIADKGYWHSVDLPFLHVQAGFDVLGAVITFLWIVWLVNAYNFMDGIDGIASLQAVIAALGWLALSIILDIPSLLLFSGVVAAASFGFLLHNWSPAKIFMGDVGSTFFGYTFAALPLLVRAEADRSKHILPIAAALFVWFFLFDSVVTRVRLVVRDRRLWTAHREHFYQRLAISGMSHARVSAVYGILTLILSLSVLISVKFYGDIGFAVLPVISILTGVLLFICFKRHALI